MMAYLVHLEVRDVDYIRLETRDNLRESLSTQQLVLLLIIIERSLCTFLPEVLLVVLRVPIRGLLGDKSVLSGSYILA